MRPHHVFLLVNPCDVAAVNNVRKQKPSLDEKVGVTIACFCAGTPSTNGTLEMLRNMGIHSLENISALRYRGWGWPGKTTAVSGKVQSELSYEQSWGDILQKHRQWRCYICPDHTGEFADLAIGDPWYKNRSVDEQGRSLILVRSARGKRILHGAINQGYLRAERKDSEVLALSQPNLQGARARLWGQLLVLRPLGAPVPHYKGFSLLHNWLRYLSLPQKAYSILGTVKRINTKELTQKVHY